MLKICVFCSARDKVTPQWGRQTALLGRMIANSGHSLVYGGGATGLMGIVSRAAKEARGYVHGVSFNGIFDVEPVAEYCNTLTVTDSMAKRKDEMVELSDAFIVLPGGLGTMEELFQVVCHNQLGVYKKPVALVNLDGYYDGLINWMHAAVDSGCMGKTIFNHFFVCKDVENALTTIEREFKPSKSSGVTGPSVNDKVHAGSSNEPHYQPG